MSTALNDDLKRRIRLALGANASDVLLGRLDKVLDDAGGDPAALKKACTQVERIVGLFVGMTQASTLASQLRSALDPFKG